MKIQISNSQTKEIKDYIKLLNEYLGNNSKYQSLLFGKTDELLKDIHLIVNKQVYNISLSMRIPNDIAEDVEKIISKYSKDYQYPVDKYFMKLLPYYNVLSAERDFISEYDYAKVLLTNLFRDMQFQNNIIVNELRNLLSDTNVISNTSSIDIKQIEEYLNKASYQELFIRLYPLNTIVYYPTQPNINVVGTYMGQFKQVRYTDTPGRLTVNTLLLNDANAGDWMYALKEVYELLIKANLEIVFTLNVNLNERNAFFIPVLQLGRKLVFSDNFTSPVTSINFDLFEPVI